MIKIRSLLILMDHFLLLAKWLHRKWYSSLGKLSSTKARRALEYVSLVLSIMLFTVAVSDNDVVLSCCRRVESDDNDSTENDSDFVFDDNLPYPLQID